jgi:hypothetical protein
MAMNIWNITKILANKTEFDESLYKAKKYKQFSINRYFSRSINTVFIAQDADILHNSIPNDIHAHFISSSIPKNMKHRVPNFSKKNDISDIIKLLMNYYQVNQKIAQQYLSIMSPDDIIHFTKLNNKGGLIEP